MRIKSQGSPEKLRWLPDASHVYTPQSQIRIQYKGGGWDNSAYLHYYQLLLSFVNTHMEVGASWHNERSLFNNERSLFTKILFPLSISQHPKLSFTSPLFQLLHITSGVFRVNCPPLSEMRLSFHVSYSSIMLHVCPVLLSILHFIVPEYPDVLSLIYQIHSISDIYIYTSDVSS